MNAPGPDGRSNMDTRFVMIPGYDLDIWELRITHRDQRDMDRRQLHAIQRGLRLISDALGVTGIVELPSERAGE